MTGIIAAMDFYDNSKTFALTINDSQRKLIAIAMRQLALNCPQMDANCMEATKDLADMLENLPEAEAADPGINHGLCY